MHSSAVLRRTVYPKTIYFKEVQPLRLKNHVSSNYDRLSGGGCLSEMTSLLTCMKNHEFDNSPCAKEFETFTQCVQNESRETNSLQASLKQGILTSEEESRKIGFGRLNSLLRKWPQPTAGGKSHIKKRPPHISYADETAYPGDKGKFFGSPHRKR